MDDDTYDTDDENMDIVVAACITTVLCVVGWYEKTYIDRFPSLNGDSQRGNYMERLIKGNDHDCHNMLRMNKIQFFSLCDLLRKKTGLEDSRYVTLEEQVAFFLHTIAHDVRNRVVKFDFHRSGETIHRHFKRVLNAVIRLYTSLVKRPEELPYPEVIQSHRFIYFKVIFIFSYDPSVWFSVDLLSNILCHWDFRIAWEHWMGLISLQKCLSLSRRHIVIGRNKFHKMF